MRQNSCEFGPVDWFWKLTMYAFFAMNIKLFGFLIGFAIIMASKFVFNNYMKLVHKCELMTGTDQVFFHDDERQCGNIVAF